MSLPPTFDWKRAVLRRSPSALTTGTSAAKGSRVRRGGNVGADERAGQGGGAFLPLRAELAGPAYAATSYGRQKKYVARVSTRMAMKQNQNRPPPSNSGTRRRRTP